MGNWKIENRLAEDFENSALKDNLIWDQIVVGVVDDSLSYRLQAKADLTLEMAVQMSRQAEAWKQNKDLIRGNAISQNLPKEIPNQPWNPKTEYGQSPNVNVV